MSLILPNGANNGSPPKPPEQPSKAKEFEDPHLCTTCNTKHHSSDAQQFGGLCLWMTSKKEGPPVKVDPMDWIEAIVKQHQVVLVIDGTTPFGTIAGNLRFLNHALTSFITATLLAEQGKIKREEVRLYAAHISKTVPIR